MAEDIDQQLARTLGPLQLTTKLWTPTKNSIALEDNPFYEYYESTDLCLIPSKTLTLTLKSTLREPILHPQKNQWTYKDNENFDCTSTGMDDEITWVKFKKMKQMPSHIIYDMSNLMSECDQVAGGMANISELSYNCAWNKEMLSHFEEFYNHKQMSSMAKAMYG